MNSAGYKSYNNIGVFTGLYDKNNCPIYTGNHVLVDTGYNQHECVILYDRYSECYKPFIVNDYPWNGSYWNTRKKVVCNDLYVDYEGRMQMTIIG